MTANTEKPLTRNMRPDGSFLDLRAYEQAGGYQAIRKVLSGGMTSQAVIDEVKDANLRGRDGAGFQTALKWSFVPRGKDATIATTPAGAL
jgi:NADH-quinone oxidoreductase subunit F